MAANGMKVNVNALGKVSHGTIDDLVARMRKAGIKPYLLPKPRKRKKEAA
jgi:transposase